MIEKKERETFSFDDEQEIYKDDLIIEEDKYYNFKKIVASCMGLIFMFYLYTTKLHKYAQGSSAIFTIIIVATILMTIGIVKSINYIFFNKDYKLEKLFLLIMIPISIVYSLILIPGMVPDESTHMRLIYSLSSQLMGVEKDTITLRGEEKYIYERLPRSPNYESYEYTYNHLFSLESNGNYVEIGEESADWKQIFGYFPSVIGVTICRFLHLGATPTLYISRMFNHFFYIWLTYFAIKKIPVGKQLLFMIALLPMCSQQMMSLSYDAVLNSACFFCLAYGLFFVYNNDEVRYDEYIKYLFSGILLLSIKGAIYSFLLMIPIFAKFKSLSNDKRIERRQKLVIFFALAILILILNFNSFKAPSPDSLGNAASKNIISWSNTEGYTISWLLANPIDGIMLFVNTLLLYGNWYFYSCLGQDLSWFTIQLNYSIFNLWFILLFLSSLHDEGEKEVEGRLKVLFGLISLIVLFLVMLSMCIYWTPLTYNIIQGVQGRYFIPIVFTILMILNNKRISLKDKIYKYINILAVILSIYTAITLINACFG